MNYWVFTVTEQRIDGGKLSAREIFNQRMKDEFWGLGERTPNRQHIEEGDQAVFYVGLPEMVFAGRATLKTTSFSLSSEEKETFSHGIELYRSDYGVNFEDIHVWQSPPQVKDLVPALGFIENKDYWGSYFQGGIRQIPKEDFEIIVGERKISLAEQLRSTEDLENQSEFALESHLEEFLFKNWNHVDWGARLLLYQTEEQSGRQFPAEQWSIDFLATDDSTGDLVVVELKKGKTSDAVVGQVLRYMSWVQENIAESNQTVRGIIIAKEIDEALRYSVKSLKNVSVKTYKVDFQLT